MTAAPNTSRNLDHLALPVPDIAIARRRLTALGFTVAADARHPFGTENACVFLADKTYLEPLGVASVEECAAAALAGNVFVSKDRAFRSHRGDNGLSGIAISSDDAEADHARFVGKGFSAGHILNFSRDMKAANGDLVTASFRLAFAHDETAPDLFLFTCQRINPLPSDRAALETHANGVVGLSELVVSATDPDRFHKLFDLGFDGPNIRADQSGIHVTTANVPVSVLRPEAINARFGLDCADGAGLTAQVLVLTATDLSVTEAVLTANGIAFDRRQNQLLVSAEPGQGVMFAFEEQQK